MSLSIVLQECNMKLDETGPVCINFGHAQIGLF